MNKRQDHVDELLTQLKALSPMPDDETVSPEALDAYDAIVEELRQLKDPRCIQPLIASFGYGMGYGIYSSAVGVLEQFSAEEVDRHLIQAVQHGERGSRMWAATMLGQSQNRTAIPYLVALLGDPEEYVRAEAVAALSRIGDPSTRLHVERLRNDPSPTVRDDVEVALENLADR